MTRYQKVTQSSNLAKSVVVVELQVAAPKALFARETDQHELLPDWPSVSDKWMFDNFWYPNQKKKRIAMGMPCAFARSIHPSNALVPLSTPFMLLAINLLFSLLAASFSRSSFSGGCRWRMWA